MNDPGANTAGHTPMMQSACFPYEKSRRDCATYTATYTDNIGRVCANAAKSGFQFLPPGPIRSAPVSKATIEHNREGNCMSENVFWVYNGWALLITVFGPLYMVVDAELRLRKGIFLLRSLSGLVYLGSIILLFFVSGWIAAALYIPLLIAGISIGSIIKHKGFG